jgi:hypothetical protein
MKRLIIASFILLYFIACSKEDTQLEYSDYIIAGRTEGPGIKYSGIINDTLYYMDSSHIFDSIRYIDINGDGINNFVLRFFVGQSAGSQYIENTILTTEKSFIAISELESYNVDTIALNDTIDNSLIWESDTCVLYTYLWIITGAVSNTGLWNNVRNKYIGTKILVHDKVLFGWI